MYLCVFVCVCVCGGGGGGGGLVWPSGAGLCPLDPWIMGSSPTTRR